MLLQLPVNLTQTHAMAFLRGLPAGLNAGEGAGAWVVDAQATQVIDSATLAVLMDLKRQALSAGASFSVQGASAHLHELARVYGVAEWLLGVK
jgi:phospholipid transport system transporter-binding protein